VGEARLDQADKARGVAERLDLSDPTLLRELGNAYTSADRLETAEALFRRSLAQDESNVHTRRRLADALAAQNAVADAVNEYLLVVDTFRTKAAAGDDMVPADRAEVIVAIAQCKQLLKTLGRSDELGPLRSLERVLREQA
jgi:tetratricopeptide (TPR) repeat protein